MTRQAYIAELSQLLFYMTAWDKAEVLEKYSDMFEECENEAALVAELGTPMKLAVTLHRSYEPTPEPTAEELAARAAAKAEAKAQAKAAAEASETEVVEEPAEEVETEAVEEAAEEVETEAVEEAAEEVETEAVEEAAEEVETEAVEEAAEEVETEAVEEAAEEVETEAVEEAAEEVETEAAEEVGQTSGKESIFAEIFNAATEAQSAVIIEETFQKEPEPIVEIERKAKYWFLIPYTIIALLIAIPVEICLIAANAALVAVALVSVAAVLYLLVVHLLSAPDLGSKLIVGGMAVMALVLAIGFATLAVWFFRHATAGFIQFLLDIARKYGYREVEVQ